MMSTLRCSLCTPDTDILINKLDIRDKAELKRAEEEFMAVKQMVLLQEPIKGRFTKTHLFRMKTPRYQRAAGEHDKIEREFRRLLDEKLGRKYLELDDALFRVMDDIAEAMYMKGAADREMMIR